MNDSTNTPEPKKSFWAKLFGGGKKDAQQSPANTVAPTPVAVTDGSSVESSLPETPPESQLGSIDTVSSTDSFASTSVDSLSANPAPAATSSFESSQPTEATTPGSAYGEGVPAGFGVAPQESPVAPTDTFPATPEPVAEEVVTPPTDPMVTPVSQQNSFDTPSSSTPSFDSTPSSDTLPSQGVESVSPSVDPSTQATALPVDEPQPSDNPANPVG